MMIGGLLNFEADTDFDGLEGVKWSADVDDPDATDDEMYDTAPVVEVPVYYIAPGDDLPTPQGADMEEDDAFNFG